MRLWQALNRHNGIGFVGISLTVLIVFKFLGYVTCPWWWVFSPLWIYIGLMVVLVGLTKLIDKFVKKG